MILIKISYQNSFKLHLLFCNMLKNCIRDIQKLSSPEKVKILQRFFKTGKGQYGEGDIFLGIQVPDTREIAKKYCDLDSKDIKKLLQSKIHEHRLLALLILIQKYSKGDNFKREKIFNFYLKNTIYINNWDLVDLSAPNIIGPYLSDKDRKILYSLARSNNLWAKRISIVSTYYFIKSNQFEDTFRISEILLNDKHDLIHKAIGWMLREIGKRNQEAEEQFLIKHYKEMPRTMLRYAIERFDEKKRKFYMMK